MKEGKLIWLWRIARFALGIALSSAIIWLILVPLLFLISAGRLDLENFGLLHVLEGAVTIFVGMFGVAFVGTTLLHFFAYAFRQPK